MKYFIAIKRFSDYKILDLSSLPLNYKATLLDNNNLQALLEFTTSFSNLQELKMFLIHYKILPKRYFDYDLVLAYYYKNRLLTLNILTAPEKKYTDINYLIATIIKNIPNKKYIYSLIKWFSQSKFYPEHIYEILNYECFNYTQMELDMIVANIVNTFCYSKKTNKIIFRKVYDLGAFLFNIERIFNLSKEQPDLNKNNAPTLQMEQLSLF